MIREYDLRVGEIVQGGRVLLIHHGPEASITLDMDVRKNDTYLVREWYDQSDMPAKKWADMSLPQARNRFHDQTVFHTHWRELDKAIQGLRDGNV